MYPSSSPVTTITAKAMAGGAINALGSTGNVGTLNLTDTTANNALMLTANSATTINIAGHLLNATMQFNQPVDTIKKALGALGG